MKWWKKILLVAVIVFIGIQFLQPKQNKEAGENANDISRVLDVPADIHSILKTICYDCHSNNTKYPWYSKIQPFGWLQASHIKNGKAELNFNEFGSYSVRRQISKLHSLANSIRDKEMPLKSYTLMHKDARLSDTQREMIMDWATRIKDSLELKK